MTSLKRIATALGLALAVLGCTSAPTTTGPGPSSQPGAPAVVGTFTTTVPALQYPVRLAAAGKWVFVSDARANAVIGYQDGAPALALTGLDTPLGVAVAGDNLYVGNAGRKDVEVYSLAQQKYLRTLGGVGAFDKPNGIAVAPDGVVYVVDSLQNVVKLFAADGTARGQLGALGTGDGQLRFPVAVAVDADRVVVADQGNKRVQIFDRAGAFVRSFGGEIKGGFNRADFQGKFTSIGSVALNGSDIYVLESLHAAVQVFDGNGAYKGTFGAAGACPTCTKMPLDITVDGQGRVLATDPEQRRFVALSTEMR
ncbi:MAG TPA: hypothetical protein VGQ83_17845 [Polyangia bacterium]|jgi:DNA-binding beta-propeller fold protein YncE